MGGAMYEVPLLLEVLLQACLSGLRMLARHPYQRLYSSHPVLDLLSQTLPLCTDVTNVTYQVAAPRDYDYPLPPVESLCRHKFFLGDDQDTLGRIQELPPGRNLHHEFVHVGKDVGEGPTQSHFVSVPSL